MLVKKGSPPISEMHPCISFFLPKDQTGANKSITADTINITIVIIRNLVKPAGAAEVLAEQVELEVVAAQNTRTPRLGNTIT